MNQAVDLLEMDRLTDLVASSNFLRYLSKEASDRLTVGQAAFFMLAAAADAKGQPQTRTRLLTSAGPDFRKSTRNSYRQLLERSRVYPSALRWLIAEENPRDRREQFLRLTKEGKTVIEGAFLALRSVSGKP